MKLYIDCTNGISGDMILAALIDLGADKEVCRKGVDSLELTRHHGEHHHCRSYRKIRNLISGGDFSAGAKEIALKTYEAIAAAEAEVHGETPETIHFHEVGRDKAIENIVGAAIAIDWLEPEEIFCSPVHDGHGTIRCSHGEIPVPVPAVAAMMKKCDYLFATDDIPTEMVTPTGLAFLMGIGAKKGEFTKVVKTGVGRGTRDMGRDGLKIHIMEG